jgi:protein SMG6
MLTDPTKYKILFDPYNPTKPLYVHDKNSNSNADDFPKTKSTDTKQQQQQAKNTGQMLNEMKMQQVEQQLKQFIDTLDCQRFSASVDKLNDLRKEYEQHYIESIQINIETAINANQDLNFWKLNYHHIIENLRKEYNSHANDATIKAYLDLYITDGFRFYEALLVQLETLYDFNFKSLMRNTPVFTPQYLPVQHQNRKFKCVLVCAHRLLISFGDLARYREMFANDAANKDYALARNYYMQAQKIVPKSSRSYNQLAILALYTRRRLDAVYYYIRCLELNSPLLTARQSLVSLFDEARKHSEELSDNLNNKKNKHVSKKQPTRIDNNMHSNRVELWYKTNETTAKNRNVFSLSSDNDDEDDDKCSGNDNDGLDNVKLNRLSTSELNRRFMNDYLNTIGYWLFFLFVLSLEPGLMYSEF